jgi:hypothetical protein
MRHAYYLKAPLSKEPRVPIVLTVFGKYKRRPRLVKSTTKCYASIKMTLPDSKMTCLQKAAPKYITEIARELVARSEIAEAILIVYPGVELDAVCASWAKEVVRASAPLRHAVPAALSLHIYGRDLDTYGRDAVVLHVDRPRYGACGGHSRELRRSCRRHASHARFRNSGMALSKAWSAAGNRPNQND